MLSREFEVIICIILAAVTVLLFFGKGDFMLKAKEDAKQKKKTAQEQLKFSRGISAFTGVWFLAELGMLFFGEKGAWVSGVYIGVIILTFIGLVWYSKKNA